MGIHRRRRRATTKGSIHREAHLEAFHRRIIAIALAHS
jgi:hypothetical protein